jgi:hypothetical protein
MNAMPIPTAMMAAGIAHVITMALLMVSWTPATSSMAISRKPTHRTVQWLAQRSPAARRLRDWIHSSAHAISSRNSENQVGRLFSWSTSKSWRSRG